MSNGYLLKRSIASILVGALLYTAPGVGCYEVLANTIGVSVGNSVSAVPAGVAGAGLGTLAQPGALGNRSLTAVSAGLQSSLPMLPTVSPMVRTQAGGTAALAASPVQAAVAAPIAGSRLLAAPRSAAVGSTALTPGHGAPTIRTLLSDQQSFSISAQDLGKMSAGEAHAAGQTAMDRVLGIDAGSRKSPLAVETGIASQNSTLGRLSPSAVKAAAVQSNALSAMLANVSNGDIVLPIITEDAVQAQGGALTPAEAAYYTEVRQSVDRVLDSFVAENSGWWARMTGKQKLVEFMAQTFRSELRKGRKPAFEVTVTEDGVKKYLRGPNGETAAEILWSQVKRQTGLSEAELMRFVSLAKRINEAPSSAPRARVGFMGRMSVSLGLDNYFGRSAVSPQAPQQNGKAVNTLVSIGRIVLAGAAVFGLQTAAVSLLPAIFGMSPVAAAWAVASGILLLPISIYSRYRMGMRDSTRLKPVKGLYDVAIGVFLGAVAIAATQVLSGAVVSTLALGLPILAAGTAVIAAANQGSSGGILDKIMAWASVSFLAPLFTTVAVGPLSIGSMLGLMALPAMTTLAFFLGRIIASAESGRPFSVPGGGLQEIRFPSYTWVMTGVVFALLTGYAPVWTNVAFGIWMFAGKTKIFNYAYGALAVWAAVTGFAMPATFLVIAFAPERAAALTEYLLKRFLPRGQPAPSAKLKPAAMPQQAPEKWPQFHYWLKTAIVLGSLLALGGVMSATVFKISSFAVNALIAGAIVGLQLYFSKKLIKMTMKATPMDELKNPEIYGIMRELRERINAERTAKGAKPIPMPEIVDVPMEVPNAFATGLSPMSAMVGVTGEMKEMTMNPVRLKAGLIRMLQNVEQESKQFLVYRKAIRGSIPGISEGAGKLELIRALEGAKAADLKALGVRALRGVLGHEFTHVMHRDMLLGGAAGMISSAISFSAYGMLWAVGHAKAALKKVYEKLLGRAAAAPKSGLQAAGADLQGRQGTMTYDVETASYKMEMVEPVTTGAAATSLLSLVKIFAALWGPILATILSMASSRTREGHADEGGGILTGDPESLALGLGLLMSWQPPAGFQIAAERLPLVAAQAHAMTVNPIEQLYRAGALPKMDALTRWAVGKEDNFFFNLFITHPDTDMRIRRLYEMAFAKQKK